MSGDPIVAWTLWASDSFDPDTPASEEANGHGLIPGLELLWHKYLTEGIDDDGRPTFTDFLLRWDRSAGGTASVSVKVRDRAVAGGAARLRAWARVEPELFRDVAEAHARLIASTRPTVQGPSALEESIRLLQLAATSADAAAFESALREL